MRRIPDRRKAISPTDCYYIMRSVVGNSILFWEKNCCGYVTDLGQAGSWTFEFCDGRTDKPEDSFIPAEAVEGASVRTCESDVMWQAVAAMEKLENEN